MCQKTRPALFVSTVFFLLASSPLWAQVNVSELVQRVSDNNQALRHYSWTMRAEVRQSGEEEPAVLVFKMRYDLDGVLQRTLLSQTGPEVGEEIEKIAQQAGAYAQPHPNKLLAFLNQASFWQGLNDNAGMIRIEGTSFLQPQWRLPWPPPCLRRQWHRSARRFPSYPQSASHRGLSSLPPPRSRC